MEEQELYELELKRFTLKKDVMSLEMAVLDHERQLFQAIRKVEQLRTGKIELSEKLAKAKEMYNNLV